MAAYDYRCRTCEAVFEVRRPVAAPAQPVRCPDGHPDAARIWSAVAVVGAPGSASGSASQAAPASSGCCGGGCCG